MLNQKSHAISPRQYISNYAVVDNAKENFRNLPSKYVLTKTKKDEQINFLMTVEYTSNFYSEKVQYLVSVQIEFKI
ncbi:MAG: hypothetical protein CM15mP22_2890 [Gammaproteobacteria bacterium]|nr:MAG: hypothetical protein CM15mP22_2890 [Gammaproteobacteria bacterium]